MQCKSRYRFDGLNDDVTRRCKPKSLRPTTPRNGNRGKTILKSIPSLVHRFYAECTENPKYYVNIPTEVGKTEHLKKERKKNIRYFDVVGRVSMGVSENVTETPPTQHCRNAVKPRKILVRREPRKLVEQASRVKVSRCVKCDYKWDVAKRRPPAHLYDPMKVNLGEMRKLNAAHHPTRRINENAMLIIPHASKAHRLKRRRSSSELYKFIVSV